MRQAVGIDDCKIWLEHETGEHSLLLHCLILLVSQTML